MSEQEHAPKVEGGDVPAASMEQEKDDTDIVEDKQGEVKDDAGPIESYRFFVGGLPDCYEEDVRKYFEAYGEVKDVFVKRDRDTQRCRGYGFVTMANKKDTEAIWKDTHIILNKEVRCLEVKDKDGGHGQGGGGGGGGESVNERKIFVRFPPDVFAQEPFDKHFSTFGEIESSDLVKTNEGTQKGFGFVVFKDDESMKKALQHGDHRINDIAVEVKKAEPRTNQAARGRDSGGYGYNNYPPRGGGGYPPQWGGGGYGAPPPSPYYYDYNRPPPYAGPYGGNPYGPPPAGYDPYYHGQSPYGPDGRGPPPRRGGGGGGDYYPPRRPEQQSNRYTPY